MQALDRVAEIETAYGGRFVQSIDGIDGSLTSQHDWFYFVNGIEGDRSAAEVRLDAGDIEWWDYRSWARQMRQPVVVGAFPEPFLHGQTVIRGSSPVGSRGDAGSIAAHPERSRSAPPQRDRRSSPATDSARPRGERVDGDARDRDRRAALISAIPSAVRFRYEVP